MRGDLWVGLFHILVSTCERIQGGNLGFAGKQVLFKAKEKYMFKTEVWAIQREGKRERQMNNMNNSKNPQQDSDSPIKLSRGIGGGGVWDGA